MSLRKIMTLLQSSVNEETSNLRRSNKVRQSLVAGDSPESEEQLPRKDPIGRCNNNKKQKSLAAEQEQQLPEPPLATAGHEMPPGETRDGVPELELPSSLEKEKLKCHEMLPEETRDGVPIVELPCSPKEKKSKIDLLFLLEPAQKPNFQEDDPSKHREHFQNAASVLKIKLVTRLTSFADNLRTKDMIILANRCFNALIELEDDYTSFHSEVEQLIAQHQQVEFSAKDKESWDDWDKKAHYTQQVQFLSSVREKLSSAQDKLSTAKAKVDSLKLKKEELLRMLTEELCKEEEKVKTLTAERDQLQESHYDIKVGLEKLDEEKEAASVAFKAINAQYNASKEEFERMSNHLLKLVKEY